MKIYPVQYFGQRNLKLLAIVTVYIMILAVIWYPMSAPDAYRKDIIRAVTMDSPVISLLNATYSATSDGKPVTGLLQSLMISQFEFQIDLQITRLAYIAIADMYVSSIVIFNCTLDFISGQYTQRFIELNYYNQHVECVFEFNFWLYTHEIAQRHGIILPDGEFR